MRKYRYFRKERIIFLFIFLILFLNILGTAQFSTEDFNYLDEKIIQHTSNFDNKIEFLMKLGHMPSLSTCIVKNNEIVWSKGYGFSDIRAEKYTTNTTIYMAGSISKTITATAIMQLYEQGLLDLDDDVSEYLPFDLKNPNHPQINITFRMLLSHRSGLGKGLKSFTLFYYFLGYSYDWLDEILLPNGSLYNPRIWLESSPGEEYEYANIGFEILGFLVERISSQIFEEYCNEHIFLPLKMYNTSFHSTDFDIDDLAKPYFWLVFRYSPLPHYDIRSSAAGGLRTNVVDLTHFLIAHMNGGVYEGVRILNESSIELMHQVHSDNDRYFDYGLGWVVWEDRDGEIYGGHGGNVFGGQTIMKYRLSDNVGVLFFWNQYIGTLRPFEKISRDIIDNLLFQKSDDF